MENKTHITYDEIKAYLRHDGVPDPSPEEINEYLDNGEWQEQYDECVRNDYARADFDRWHILQRMLGTKMNFETVMRIDAALWDEELELYDLFGGDEMRLTKGDTL